MTNTASHVLPAPLAVRNLLEDLLGREVTVRPGDPMQSADLAGVLAALYTDDTLRLSAVIGMDLPLAAYCAAALGLMPAGGAQDSIQEKVLSPILAENASELCNVLTGLLNREGAAHLKLYQLYQPGQQVPADAGAHLLALGNRLDLTVEVSRYGSGRFALSIVD